MSLKRGKFIVFTGLDGSGVSTISQAAAAADPHGIRIKTPSGLFERIRDDVDSALRTTCPVAHFLYYLASLAETNCEIERRLASGRNVYCDRFLIDTVVSHRAGGLNVELRYDDPLVRFSVPDLTILIRVDEEIRQERIQRRGKSNLDCTLDNEDLRKRFQIEFNRLSNHWIEVDNSASSPLKAIEQVQRHVIELLEL